VKFKVGDRLRRVADKDGRVPLAWNHCNVLYAGTCRWVDAYKGQDVYVLEDQWPGKRGKYQAEFLAQRVETEWEMRPSRWKEAVEDVYLAARMLKRFQAWLDRQ
jgi:hypothetical protein